MKRIGQFLLLIVALLTCGGLAITMLKPRLSSSTTAASNPHALKQPCGTTPGEARAHGCHFDVNSFCWLPDVCWDASLSEEFDSYKDWKWWRDENATDPISYELVSTGEFTDLYVEWEYHLVHCTTTWKKMHRALLRGGLNAIDAYIGSYQHTLHCEDMLLSGYSASLKDVNTVIRIKYPDCGALRWEK